MKDKISISIEENILNKVDSIIGQYNIRNRSQALEYLIEKALEKKNIRNAIILAGGSKRELEKNKTYTPLIKIDGEETIIHSVKILSKFGIKNIIVAAGPIENEIFEILGDGSNFGVSIKYIKDDETGTAGAVKKTEKMINDDFFIIYGDTFFDFDLEKMSKFHNSDDSLMTLAVTTTEREKSKDRVIVEGDKVVDFKHSPKEGTFTINAGILICSSEIFKHLPRKGSLEKDVFSKLAKKGEINGYNFYGKWKHVG